jgi:hypothetical protein
MMGEVEFEFECELKVDTTGKITGTQRLPFEDSPIVDGRIEGSQFEVKVPTEFFGDTQITSRIAIFLNLSCPQACAV